MRIETSKAMVGADIHDCDLASVLDDACFEQIEATFLERGVVCLRNQHLEPDRLLEFAHYFGEPDVHFLTHYTLPEYPTIMRVSNIRKDGRDIGFADAGRVWHSDGSYMQTPVAVSMLYAIEVPEENGKPLGATQFACAWAAYDALPQSTRARIASLRSVHQVAGRRKRTGTGAKDRAHEQAQPEAVHPLVRVHPGTGRKYLFVSSGECSRVLGMSEAEGLALIESLAVQVQAPEFRYVHEWQVGDLLLWDNRAVQHLASFDYQWPRHRRLMHRVTITEGTGRC